MALFSSFVEGTEPFLMFFMGQLVGIKNGKTASHKTSHKVCLHFDKQIPKKLLVVEIRWMKNCCSQLSYIYFSNDTHVDQSLFVLRICVTLRGDPENPSRMLEEHNEKNIHEIYMRTDPLWLEWARIPWDRAADAYDCAGQNADWQFAVMGNTLSAEKQIEFYTI